jgi:hypothetical protein
MGKVEIDSIPNKNTLLHESKEFYGDSTQTTSAQGIDSAYNRTLQFLDKQKHNCTDDYSLHTQIHVVSDQNFELK